MGGFNCLTRFLAGTRNQVSKEEEAMQNAWSDDFSHRPSWCDAGMALAQVEKGNAKARIPALKCRSAIQNVLFRLGLSVQWHCIETLLVGIVILVLFSVLGLRHAYIQTNMEKLWVEKGGRLDTELAFMPYVENKIEEMEAKQREQAGLPPKQEHADDEDSSLSSAGGMAFLMVIQTAFNSSVLDVMNKASLMAHLEMMVNVSRFQINKFGANWTLHDICFKPDLAPSDDALAQKINQLMAQIIPCMIITPLDCFYEGALVHGPYPKVNVSKTLGGFIASLLTSLPKFVDWSNFNPDELLAEAYQLADLIGYGGKVEGFQDMFKRLGIDRGYLDRPCLDPFAEYCGALAPNVNQSVELPLGKCFTGGCKGLAEKVMQWPEDLIFGGVARHPNGATPADDPAAKTFCNKPDQAGKQTTRIKSIEAIESVMLLASPDLVLKRFENGTLFNKPGLNVTEWDYEKAKDVLDSWSRNFSNMIYNSRLNRDGKFRTEFIKHRGMPGQIVPPVKFPPVVLPIPGDTSDAFSFLERETSTEPMLHPLSGTSLGDMLQEFSKFNKSVIAIGYLLMIIYAGLMLGSCSARGVYSCTGVAMSGVLLVTAATVAGLACSAIVGIQFNAATTNIVPFLTLGLGVDDMFLLVHNYQEIVQLVPRNELGYLLKETGLSVLLTSICNILSFSVGGLIPVPALRSFCWQVAIVLVFNVVCILTLYPAMLSIDLLRRKNLYIDIFCCIQVNKDKVQPAGAQKKTKANGALPEKGATQLATFDTLAPYEAVTNGHVLPGAVVVEDHTNESESVDFSWMRSCASSDTSLLQSFVDSVYTPILSKKPVKIAVLLFFAALLGAGIAGCVQITHGLELTDVVPKNTAPYDFLTAREKYFSFYLFDARIKDGFDYAMNQRLVHEYRNALGNVTYVVKNQGSLGQTYWLKLFSDWVRGMQDQLNQAFLSGSITAAGPKCNAKKVLDGLTDNQVLAWKMLMNNLEGVNRVDVKNSALIDANGVVNPRGFYNYLTAWFHYDRITYEFAQGGIIPAPNETWKAPEIADCRNITDEEIRIPPLYPIFTSKIPFFITGLIDTPRIVDLIKQTRKVCDEFNDVHGLPNYPSGIPFTFWEQYIALTRHLVVSIVTIMVCVFAVISLLLLNPWTGGIVTLVIGMMVVELGGYMGIIGLKLNPISAVTLVTAVGIAVEFTVHMALSYLTALGTPNQRMHLTLQHMFEPVLHGGISTLLGIIMLAFSKFEFIRQYFFMVMAGLIVLGLLNGLVLLPVLLSLIGPPSEVRPTDGSYHLAPPSPPVPHSSLANGGHSNGVDGLRKRSVRDSVSTVPDDAGSPPVRHDSGLVDSKAPHHKAEVHGENGLNGATEKSEFDEDSKNNNNYKNGSGPVTPKEGHTVFGARPGLGPDPFYKPSSLSMPAIKQESLVSSSVMPTSASDHHNISGTARRLRHHRVSDSSTLSVDTPVSAGTHIVAVVGHNSIDNDYDNDHNEDRFKGTNNNYNNKHSIDDNGKHNDELSASSSNSVSPSSPLSPLTNSGIRHQQEQDNLTNQRVENHSGNMAPDLLDEHYDHLGSGQGSPTAVSDSRISPL